VTFSTANSAESLGLSPFIRKCRRLLPRTQRDGLRAVNTVNYINTFTKSDISTERLDIADSNAKIAHKVDYAIDAIKSKILKLIKKPQKANARDRT
jgi:hypothetical protein